MSTRATIKIVKKGRKPEWLYHHSDGYPDGVGCDLLEFLSYYNNEKWIPKELSEYIREKEYGYEITEGQHGDEEYGYLIDCDKHTLRCYWLECDGYEWKEENIECIPGQRKDKVVSKKKKLNVRLDICNPESDEDPFYRIIEITDDEYEYLKSFMDYQKDHYSECLVNIIKAK